MKFNSLIPELSVSDINKSKEFYLKIGFKIVYQRIEDKFIFLELEDNQIMIQEINSNWEVGELIYPFGRGINISMAIKDIDSYYLKLKNIGINFFKEMMINEYQVNMITYQDKEFLIQDPDGYLLRFNN